MSNVRFEYSGMVEEGVPPVAAALLVVALAIEHHAIAIERLGNADASTPMGALEALGVVLKEGLGDIADATRGLD